MDVKKVLFYGSDASDGVYDYLGRAHYSQENIWNYYWNWNPSLMPQIPLEYWIKAIILDKAGNYLIETCNVKLYDFINIELLTDIVFGDIIEYDSSR